MRVGSTIAGRWLVVMTARLWWAASPTATSGCSTWGRPRDVSGAQSFQGASPVSRSTWTRALLPAQCREDFICGIWLPSILSMAIVGPTPNWKRAVSGELFLAHRLIMFLPQLFRAEHCSLPLIKGLTQGSSMKINKTTKLIQSCGQTSWIYWNKF